MWSSMRSGATSIMSSSDFDSLQGSVMVSSDTSTGPSRLDSFSSSGEYVQSSDFAMQTSFDDTDKAGLAAPASPISSSSSRSKLRAVSPSVEPASTNSTTDDHSSNDQVEVEELKNVNKSTEKTALPTIQKWVDDSCVQTEKLKLSGELVSINVIRENHTDEVTDEGGNPSSDFALQQALEYSLRSVSPNFVKTGSLDGAFSSLGDYQSQLTPTENMLLGLGFGGPDLGIPVRFLKSWRQQVIKRKITELQGLLVQSRKSPSPTGSARQYNPKPVWPSKHKETMSAKPTSPVAPVLKEEAEEHDDEQVVVTKSIIQPTEKQLQLEKLKRMRHQLRRSATFSSFTPNSVQDLKQVNGRDHRMKGAMSDKKYQKLRDATRGNIKDRRRIFGTRQSSLPISLETLPEEDESGRPTFLHQKSSSLDITDAANSASASSTISINSSQSDVTLEGNEDGCTQVKRGLDALEKFQRNGPKIPSSGPSVPSLVRSDSVLSEAEHLVHDGENFEKEKYDRNRLLVIKQMIESKDSGFGNDISSAESPQLSPEPHQPGTFMSGSNSGKVVQSAEVRKLNTNQCTDTQECDSQTDESNDKLNKVDLCIQCDFTDSDSQSDVEYLSAGVQTSPWLQSGELSPLFCTEVESSNRPFSEQETHLDNLSYPDGFIAERRLSRIEEVTEGTMSYQSEEDKLQPSMGSHQDSSQTVSTGGSSRTNSTLFFSDGFKTYEEPRSGDIDRGSDYDFKKLQKKIYKEMLHRNSEGDLVYEGRLIQKRATYQEQNVPGHFTVDETLRKAAEKLEICVNDINEHDAKDEEEDKQISDSKNNDELDDNHETLLEESLLQPQHISQSFSKSSSVTSPAGSLRSRQFFASNSFFSFTDNVNHSGRSSETSKSDVSDVEEEVRVNFSLTGNDMNLVSRYQEDYNPYFPVNDEDIMPYWEKKNPFVADSYRDVDILVPEVINSDDPFVRSEKVFNGFVGEANQYKESRKVNNLLTMTRSVDMPLESSYVEKDLPSKASKVCNFSPFDQIGASSEPSIMDSVSEEKKLFTETLEIEVPSMQREKNVVLSQCFVSLQPPLQLTGNSNSSSSVRSGPYKYSSKYYFSVDDYSMEFENSSDELAKSPNMLLSKRRRSLINAHLSAKMHIFDEFVCERSGNCWSSTDEGLSSPDVDSREVDSEDERGAMDILMTPMRDRKGQEKCSSFRDDIKLQLLDTRWDNIQSYKVGKNSMNRISIDSQASLRSSISSSEVDRYVDIVLDNALEDVRGSLQAEKLNLAIDIPVCLHSNHDFNCEGQKTASSFHEEQLFNFNDALLVDDQTGLESSGVVLYQNKKTTNVDQKPCQPLSAGQEKQNQGKDFQTRLSISNQQYSHQIMQEMGETTTTDTCQPDDGRGGRTLVGYNGHLTDGRVSIVLVNGSKLERLKSGNNLNKGFSLKINNDSSQSTHSESSKGHRDEGFGQVGVDDKKLTVSPLKSTSGSVVSQISEKELASKGLQGMHNDGRLVQHNGYSLGQQESSHCSPKRSQLVLSYEELCSKAQDLISNMNALIAGNH